MNQPEVKNTKKITKKQKAVLDFIEKTIDETGIAPTVRDICEGLGLSSPSTVHVHLRGSSTVIRSSRAASPSLAMTESPRRSPSPKMQSEWGASPTWSAYPL